MEIAGSPPVSKIALTCLGRLPVGRWRRRGQPLLRPRHRRPDEADRHAADPRRAASSPRAALRVRIRARALCRSLLLSLTSTCWPLRWRWRVRRLRRRLHDLAQAAHAAEHRDRRRRRRDAPARRLGGDPRLAVVDRGLPVRDRLLLDPAAFLGAQPADEGRVREGRRADDAGRPRRARDPPADRAVHAAAVRGHAAAVLRRRVRVVYLVASIVLGLAFIAGALCLYRQADRRTALRLYLFSLAYLALLFGAMVARREAVAFPP